MDKLGALVLSKEFIYLALYTTC